MISLQLDYSKRHCRQGKDGRFFIEGSDFSNPEECRFFRNHKLRAGQTEFLRWIRAFGGLTVGVVTEFDDEKKDWLKLGPDFSKSLNKEVYCENYGDKVKCFLDVPNEIAIVEIHDWRLEEAANEAYKMVRRQYESMRP